jgi:ADP-heptose:LPS heptosyltransferase
MNPDLIRIIDKYIGQVLCFLLTCCRYLWDSLSQSRDSTTTVHKVLFIKLVEQGATVLAYSAIREAIRMYGKNNIYFCVFIENQSILHLLDLIPQTNVIPIRHNNIFFFIVDIVRLIFFSRKEEIDASIDMEFFSRASAILAYLVGARNRVGLHRFTSELPYRGDLMTHRIQYNPYLHTAQTYLLLVKALAMDPRVKPLPKYPIKELNVMTPIFAPGDNEKALFLKKLLIKGISLNERPVILLNPNASDMLPLRKWPSINFIQLAHKILAQNPEAIILITGAPLEKTSAHLMCQKINSERVFSLAGETTLRELLILYAMSDILVTNDSGPGHFAAMTNIHSIVLFGPETPLLFGAIGGNYHPVSAGLACSPCVNVFNHRFSACRENRCMEEISVEKVFSIIKDHLKNHS